MWSPACFGWFFAFGPSERCRALSNQAGRSKPILGCVAAAAPVVRIGNGLCRPRIYSCDNPVGEGPGIVGESVINRHSPRGASFLTASGFRKPWCRVSFHCSGFLGTLAQLCADWSQANFCTLRKFQRATEQPCQAEKNCPAKLFLYCSEVARLHSLNFTVLRWPGPPPGQQSLQAGSLQRLPKNPPC